MAVTPRHSNAPTTATASGMATASHTSPYMASPPSHTRKSRTISAPSSLLSLSARNNDSSSMLCTSDDDESEILSTALCNRTVLPLEAFYKAVTTDLLLCRNESFFSYLFSQIFSRKIKAYIDGVSHSYDSLRLHFLKLRKAYFTHAADGLLRWGPVLSAPENGGREGYLAAHFVCATFQSSSSSTSPSTTPSPSEEHDQPSWSTSDEEELRGDTLLVSDTMEISWVEGKDGEMRRISRFDRVTRRAS